jgi:hypothetical protein
MLPKELLDLDVLLLGAGIVLFVFVGYILLLVYMDDPGRQRRRPGRRNSPGEDE